MFIEAQQIYYIWTPFKCKCKDAGEEKAEPHSVQHRELYPASLGSSVHTYTQGQSHILLVRVLWDTPLHIPGTFPTQMAVIVYTLSNQLSP